MNYKYMAIRSTLSGWFRHNRRELPWRADKDPYKIWLSEIILQQTRVSQGLPYFQRFIERFPSVIHLAGAEEQEVLRLWQGLGYYSRARNLHHTAKKVAAAYNGKFPDSLTELLSLKGIGDYTAAAILSIAFNKPYAVLDGNVYRVLSRLFGLAEPINVPASAKIFKDLAQEVLDQENPGEHNEAIMEFGATVCTPKSPSCNICPLLSHCDAFHTGVAEQLPEKLKGKEIKIRHLHYFLVHDEQGLFLHKRAEKDIWKNLYDLPLIEKSSSLPLIDEELAKLFGEGSPEIVLLNKVAHQLTHRLLQISFYKAGTCRHGLVEPENYIFVPYGKLNQYPLPRPVELFLKGHLGGLEF